MKVSKKRPSVGGVFVDAPRVASVAPSCVSQLVDRAQELRVLGSTR